MNTNDIARYVWLGRRDQFWYSEAQTLFEELFGEERLELVTKLFAATSINTSLKSNVTLFRRALHEIENNLPIGDYLPNIKQQLQQIREGKELTGRKINSFARAMSGDKEAVVVDIWLLRAFHEDKQYPRKILDIKAPKLSEEDVARMVQEWKKQTPILFIEPTPIEVQTLPTRLRSGGATDRQYTLIEDWVRKEARAMGIEPRQLSAMIWAGIRIYRGGDANTHYRTVLLNQLYSMFNETH